MTTCCVAGSSEIHNKTKQVTIRLDVVHKGWFQIRKIRAEISQPVYSYPFHEFIAISMYTEANRSNKSMAEQMGVKTESVFKIRKVTIRFALTGKRVKKRLLNEKCDN